MTVELDRIFPYPTIRPQQQQIMDFINKCLKKDEVAVIEAATGVGKTIAALTPLLTHIKDWNASVAEDDVENKLKLVILGRTHSQADRVIDELKEITSNTMTKISAVSKRGRQALCINDEVKGQHHTQFQAICSGVRREMSCKPFLNSLIPSKTSFVTTLLDQPISSAEIIEISEINQCCPAEVTKQVIQQVEVISCSYHYIFSHQIRERFLQSLQLEMDNLVLVVDECHNLSEATMQMNTQRLSLFQIQQALVEIRNRPLSEEMETRRYRVKHIIEALEAHFLSITEEKLGDAWTILKLISVYLRNKNDFEKLHPEHDIATMRDMAKYMIEKSITKQFAYLSMIAEFLEFLLYIVSRDDQLVLETEYNQSKQIILKKIDPSGEINKILQAASHSTLMTGTLGHPYMFRAQTGLYDNVDVLQLPSPYEQPLGVYQVNGLTSKYKSRTDNMFEKYVQTIKEICKNEVNIGLYVTSYSFMQKLFDHGLDTIDKPLFRAEQWMDSQKTEELLTKFRKAKTRGGGLLCSVLGGRSSEGTDFPGDDMEIIIIAGLPYPPKSIEQQAIYDYYKERTKSAWNLCFTTPAFTSINQAAGRAVRSLNDRAMIFLLDERIAKNRKQLTGWMQTAFQKIDIHEIRPMIKDFFDK